VRRRISPRLAYAIGGGLEALFRALRLPHEPPMTRFAARQLATAHWYANDAAKADLGYVPSVSMREGFTRLAAAARRAGG
jgi:hypothetical protein